MGAESIVIFTFWTALFTALSVQKLVLRDDDATDERLDQKLRATTSETRLSIKDNNSETAPAHKFVKERLLHAGLRRQSDLKKFLLFQRICYSIPLFVIAGLLFLLHVPFLTALLVGVISGMIFIVIPRI